MMANGRIRPLWPVLISVLLALFATGCSTSTENGGLSLVDEQGNHPANFLGTHPTFAVSSVAQCRSCHGDDLTGGIANTSCFQNTANCHHGTQTGWVVFPSGPPQGHGASAKRAPGSSGFVSCQICHASDFSGGGANISCFLCHTPPHPNGWRSFNVYKHTDTDAGNAPVCAQCHLNGANSPVPPPSPPAPAGTSPGCFNSTLCHGQAPHAVPFLNHTGVTDATFNDPFPDGCASCHAVTGTSPVAAAPLCSSCHTGGSPLLLLSCTSCHAEPPAGAAYPNFAGAHAVHLGLDDTLSPVSCDTCHTGIGSGSQAHYDGAKAQVSPGDVAFVTTYDAQSGAPSFDNAALTCTNVSCHGGQTTTNWQTGTIDVTSAADCLLCHAFGTAQYNSYSSGEHDFHVNGQGFSCTFCHNTTSLAVSHLSALSTTAMEGPASDTVGGAGTAVTSYIAPTCISACHSAPGRNW